jgi:hypothetical protein
MTHPLVISAGCDLYHTDEHSTQIDYTLGTAMWGCAEEVAMPKFFSKSAVLIFLALSIEPTSAQMCCGANSRPFSVQHQGFRSMTFSPYRLGGQKYLPPQGVRNLPRQSVRNLSSQPALKISQRHSPRTAVAPPQSSASPHGPSGSLPQGASGAPQGINYSPQGASYTPQGGSYEPAGQSPRRAVSYCILSRGETCPTLSSPGSYCECRDNFGRHFRGVAQ